MYKKTLTRTQLILNMALCSNANDETSSNIEQNDEDDIIENASRHDLIMLDINDIPECDDIVSITTKNTELFEEFDAKSIQDEIKVNVEEDMREDELIENIFVAVDQNNGQEDQEISNSQSVTTEETLSRIFLLNEDNNTLIDASIEQVGSEILNSDETFEVFIQEVPKNDEGITDMIIDDTFFEELHLLNTITEENMDEDKENEDLVIENESQGTDTDREDGSLLEVLNSSKRNIKKKKHKMDRKQKAKLKSINKHQIKEACKDHCKKQCKKSICEEQRNLIHNKYWSMSWMDQRRFILNTCSRMPVKRRTLPDITQRNLTFCYGLTDKTGQKIDVCKTFFLTTLGYHPKNDKAIFNVLHKSKLGTIIPEEDKRGKKSPLNKIDREAILNHVETFHPNISHYRREHAPRVKYLPNDVTIAFMHQDFLQKYPQFKCSYEGYRKILFAENIRFTKLGHEECETCEVMKLHNQNHSKENIDLNCTTCENWTEHIGKAKAARKLYQKHANTENDTKTVCVSADLEKIIMLPRMESFKKVLFTPRLVAYNETFVPLGLKSKIVLPFAVLWHEALRGRGKEELISTFFQFLLHYRDVENFIIWLDNCAAQNKNWAFMTFLVYIVNSSKVAAKSIQVYYFEPGHTFMSADSLHHQIELSLKRRKKTCDFNDFVKAVQMSNKEKIVTKVMNITDFYDFKDLSSIHKRNNGKQNEKVLLSQIVNVHASRGSFELEYKCDLESNDTKKLNFLKHETFKKKHIPDPISYSKPCGILQDKKSSIITNLLDLMEDNRKEFWLNLPVNE